MKLRFGLDQLVLIIMTSLIVLQSLLSYYIPIFSYFDEVVTSALVVLGLFRVFRLNKRWNKVYLRILIFLVLFLLCGFTSRIINKYKINMSLLVASFLSIKFLLLLSSMYLIAIRDRGMKSIYNTLTFWGTLNIIVMFLNIAFPKIYYYLFPMMKYNGTRLNIIVSTGLFRQAAMNSFFMAALGILYYTKVLLGGKKKDSFFCLLFMSAAFFTLRMKTIAGLVLVIVLGALILTNSKKKIKYVLLCIISLPLLIYFLKDHIIFTYLQYFTTRMGMSARMAMWITSIKILRDYFPFGVGFGLFGSAYSRLEYSDIYYKYHLNNIAGLQPFDTRTVTDTYWPSIIGETGIIGLIAYGIIFYIILKHLYRKVKILYNKKEVSMTSVTICVGFFYFILALAESMGEGIYNSAPQYIILAVIIGQAFRKSIQNEI